MTHALDASEVSPVVRIRVKPTAGNPDGILEINRSDYNKNKHQLVDEAQASMEFVPPPAPEQPKGSATLTGEVPVSNTEPQTIQAGMIVGLAHNRSGLSIADWNALGEESREKLIADELTLIRNKNNYKAPAGPFAPQQ